MSDGFAIAVRASAIDAQATVPDMDQNRVLVRRSRGFSLPTVPRTAGWRPDPITIDQRMRETLTRMKANAEIGPNGILIEAMTANGMYEIASS
jgi:hypothetical protein